jgi:hypothetical protein
MFGYIFCIKSPTLSQNHNFFSPVLLAVRGVFKQIFAPTEKLAPTGKVSA